MENLKLKIDNIFDTIPNEKIFGQEVQIKENIKTLHNKSGKGNEFLGWLDTNSYMHPEKIKEIKSLATTFYNKTDYIVVIGIGGSYLGAKAVIAALSDSFQLLKKSSGPKIIFAGFNICEDYLFELTKLLENKSFSLVVISKSGTTTEPAIAFRVLKEKLEEKYGSNNYSNRIIAITDEKKGALGKIAKKEGFKTLGIPDNIGGRFSVLSSVGLLPIALAGYDIEKLIGGALQMEKLTGPDIPFDQNPAAKYAAARNSLYNEGKIIEILVNYNPKLHYFAEWWKQLFGESEGKEGKGIFPACVDLTTDLHSMGQYIQEGKRNIFETVISVEQVKHELRIPHDYNDLDNLNYISGKRISEVNKMAEQGTLIAHLEGGVPNINITIPELNEYYMGQLIYFFEKACAISGYALGVNPFDQPGVEEYKKNMFKLLGRP
ncbi:glucose-6-phosphate isomerase [Bacteroidota bacterium]